MMNKFSGLPFLGAQASHFCDLIAYADGSALGNPGPGGWAVLILESDGRPRTPLTGWEPCTTNNRMELLAAINAHKAIGPDVHAVLFLDSEYVVKGLSLWVFSWKLNGWKTASGKPVANRDLWEELWAIHQASKVEPRWIKGHSGDPYNEAVDQLAKAAAMQEASR